jgi:hypothetical protein
LKQFKRGNKCKIVKLNSVQLTFLSKHRRGKKTKFARQVFDIIQIPVYKNSTVHSPGSEIEVIHKMYQRNLFEAEFVLKLRRDNNKTLAVSFNHSYIDLALSISKHNFHKYVHLIYPDELEIKDTADWQICLIYRYLLNSDSIGRLTTTLYGIRGDLDLHLLTFFLLLCLKSSPEFYDRKFKIYNVRGTLFMFVEIA